MGIWWVYDGYMIDIWWKYDGNMMGIWWVYDGNMMEIWWKYDGNMMEIWWKYDGNLTHDGSMVLVFFCANMTGVYWWDPWHTIYSSTMDPSWVMEIDGMNVDPHSQFFLDSCSKVGDGSGMFGYDSPQRSTPSWPSWQPDPGGQMMSDGPFIHPADFVVVSNQQFSAIPIETRGTACTRLSWWLAEHAIDKCSWYGIYHLDMQPSWYVLKPGIP